MSTWEQEQKRVAEVGKTFDVNARRLQMEIVRDEGLHRHIKFAQPGSGLYRFDLVTWPGHLAISGDVETFVFSREPDMFEFFGGRRSRINPTYWAEKVKAGREQLTSYDEASARQQVLEYFTEAVKDGGVPRGLGREIREYILTGKNLDYIEQWDQFVGPDGQPREDLFVSDRLHSNARGYQIRADAVRPHLR